MAGLVNFLSNVFQAPSVQTATPVVRQTSSNPYSNNPFVNYNGNSFSSRYYAQNKPVKGGYFAGYYNGKQNIVGRRLFVEV
ncbi:MAG: hypothetical protein UDK34_05740 [Cyanobacteriota bacterium]|nr:hypothetical protein [Cyanobacteriota bacterium]